MNIRAITKDEYQKSNEIVTVAFDLGIDCNPQKEIEGDDYTARRVLFDGDKMCATIDSWPYKAYFNGKIVGMSGIGGVACFPEERRKGYIRELLTHVIRESYERGDTISYLYPFSHDFYHQFGYEFVMQKNKVTIPVEAFKQYKNHDKFKLLRPGDDTAPVKTIYTQFASDKNCMIARTDKMWESLLEKEPFTNNRYVYLRYNKDGVADAYIIFHGKAELMTVEELAWANFDALCSMLGFIYSYLGKYKKFDFVSPSFINYFTLINEPYQVAVDCLCDGMMRIINAKSALETLDALKVAEITIKIADDGIAENNGCFKVFSKDGATVAEKTDKEPDMLCDIRALAQLMSGYISFDDAIKTKRITVKSGKDDLLKLFIKRTPCIYGHF